MEQEIKKRSVHRINIIAGQIEGIKKMIESEVYCVDIINQSNAVQNSLRSLNALILENHLKPIFSTKSPAGKQKIRLRS